MDTPSTPEQLSKFKDVFAQEPPGPHDPTTHPQPGDMLAKHYKLTRSGDAEVRLVVKVKERKPDCLTRIVYHDNRGQEHQVSRGGWIRWAKEASVLPGR